MKRKRLTPRQKQIKMRRLMHDMAFMLLASIITFIYAILFIKGYDTFIAVSVTVVVITALAGIIITARWRQHQEQKRRRLNYYYKLKRDGRI